jgi:hypothetical protein
MIDIDKEWHPSQIAGSSGMCGDPDGGITFWTTDGQQRRYLPADRIEALEAELKALREQEPVAWSVRDRHRRFVTESAKRAEEYKSLGQTIVPLYDRNVPTGCDCPAEKMPFGRCCKAAPAQAKVPEGYVLVPREVLSAATNALAHAASKDAVYGNAYNAMRDVCLLAAAQKEGK